MSKILGPDGRPTAPQINPQALMQILSQLDQRITALTQQFLFSNIYLEYVVTKIEESGLEIDMSDFETFAEKRYQEIDKNVKSMQEQMKQEDSGRKEVNLEDI